MLYLDECLPVPKLVLLSCFDEGEEHTLWDIVFPGWRGLLSPKFLLQLPLQVLLGRHGRQLWDCVVGLVLTVFGGSNLCLPFNVDVYYFYFC